MNIKGTPTSAPHAGGSISAMTNRIVRLTLAGLLAICAPQLAGAHVSEKALVLLLPTDVFSMVGTGVVALTFVALAFFPANLLARAPKAYVAKAPSKITTRTSTLATAIVLGLIALGFWGPRDPLTNLLPLAVWTFVWMLMPLIQALIGDLWRYINPWRGVLSFSGRTTTNFNLPNWLGYWLTLPQFIAAALFSLVFIAPDDPEILARVTLSYWATHMALALIFGDQWLTRAEPLTVFFTLLATSVRTYATQSAPLGLGLLAIIALATGSFDSLNETFWWLSQININPLEFPGRSGVMAQNSWGYLLSLPLLCAVFFACHALGLMLVGQSKLIWPQFAPFAIILLPIFTGYHFAHFLTAIYVNMQYVAVAFSDPLQNGANILGYDQTNVTTGLFNTLAGVRVVWLLQAGAIVVGHMASIYLAHKRALQLLIEPQRAAISQLPLAAFMVAYTLFGLWLLASPTAG